MLSQISDIVDSRLSKLTPSSKAYIIYRESEKKRVNHQNMREKCSKYSLANVYKMHVTSSLQFHGTYTHKHFNVIVSKVKGVLFC